MEINNSNYTILIVDDIKANVLLLKAIIKKNNFQVIEASNGQECLDMLEEHKPDLILLDIMMPILDGYQTMNIIRNGDIKPDVAIIFITALDNKNDIVKGFNSGANDYISKPFNNEELEVRVNHQISLIAAKREIEQKTNDLITVIKNRDRLYSVIAHDLRSPLSSIKMILSLLSSELSEEKISKELYELLTEANRTTEDLFILLDNLLKWTKTQTGKLNISIQKIDIISIIHGLIDLYNLMSRNKNINIKFASKIEALEVDSDPDIIKTIVRNLISNAIKFSYSENEVIINIEEKDNDVIISVKDNGCGISEENKSSILVNKDSEYTSYGTNNEEGSGLGLNLCVEFTHKIGGEIWFESELDKGSIFYVSIPKILKNN
jgi:two-component system sensor histidine kinase/response regulator